MSITDKLLTVAENVSKVYKVGQLSVVASSEALKGNARAMSQVALKDISPIEHNVGVQISTPPAFAGLLTGCTFEDTDFGYIRSTPFTVAADGNYTIALKLADDSKWGDWVVAWANWAADDSPPYNGMNNPSKNEWLSLSEGYTYRLFLGAYKGLKAADILSATIEIGDNVVAPPVSDGDTDLSSVKITVSGKNLLNLEGREVINFGGFVNTSQRTFPQGKGIILGLAANNYYGNHSYDYAITKKSVTYYMGANAYGIGFDLELKPDTIYTISGDNGGNSASARIMEYDTEGNFLGTHNNGTKTRSNTAWGVLQIMGTVDTTFTMSNIQVEVGFPATPYEQGKPSVEYTANADGVFEGVKSIYPTTVVSADAEVTVSVNYIKDIDKAFAALTKTIDEGEV